VPVQRCTLTLPIPLQPYGPYGLYRASVPVQRCTLTLPIPLIPLRSVQPVQSRSACTTVHFNFTYTSTPRVERTACTEPQCLYNGALYLYLYLYSPYGPYSMYRASVTVQRCTLPLPIPLLPLWAVQPVQGHSACTKVHFNFTYTSIPLWTVRPLQSHSACTSVHFTFTYTSNRPMARTASTEPQCLCKGEPIPLTYTDIRTVMENSSCSQWYSVTVYGTLRPIGAFFP